MTAHSAGPTMGVEEEFLLVDPASGVPVADNAGVAAAAREAGAELQLELGVCQIETTSAVCSTADELGTEIRRLRRVAADAAGSRGRRLLAAGVPLVGPWLQAVSDDGRYRAIEREFVGLTRQHGTCGCHVHVGVPDREAAVAVSNRVTPWLPALLALTANSPVYCGTDTGCASWRSIMWRRWPSAGPPPRFADAADYDRTIASMIECGSILDEAMVYWDIRPSATFPTVEVRISDVPATAAETLVLALLVRALVVTALSDAACGEPEPCVPAHVLEAAYWRAARFGVDADAIDPFECRRVPVGVALGRLLEYVGAALDGTGDRATVTDGVCAAVAEGNGARRQRSMWRRRGLLADVVGAVAASTVDGCCAATEPG